ncbi:dTDP-4-dehydrorhamnose reductase [Paenibacillus sp. R14(2021)]|uniref:dTDP-4-dehydrorhamnose reductase n=1 Tax=Paenibacillus sp. R14(2021) TaxID=2859228 RepID=UPI002157431B|nr:dTDP-4-dehydrorhamnose reductase [Paenibacillus sp. R14(2021)]
MNAKKPMRIIVTGANGQLGCELVNLPLLHQKGVSILGFGRGGLDVTNLQSCREVLKRYQPEAVIHCAAFTDVDKAEVERQEAYRINAEGTRNIVKAAREFGVKILYVSTSFVFDGAASRPFKENDVPVPLTVYGHSKLAGEREVLLNGAEAFIVRTSWLYGRYGSNFVENICKLANSGKEIQVFNDQLGRPTYARDLAEFLITLVQTNKYGIYHAAGNGVCSRYQFAQAILEENKSDTRLLVPCTETSIPGSASRQAYSVLHQGEIERQGLTPLRHWRAALTAYMRE